MLGAVGAKSVEPTVPGRRAFTAERREANRDRDDARLRLARELGERAEIAIRPEQGFLSAAPGTLAKAAAVVEDANALIDGIGEERLLSSKTKGGFIARDF